MDTRLAPWKPELPIDITRMVFELAAADVATGAILCRVSKSVHAWVACLLYYAVVYPPRSVIHLPLNRERMGRTWKRTRHLFLSDGFGLSEVASSLRRWQVFRSLCSLVIDSRELHAYYTLLETIFPSLTHLTIIGRASTFALYHRSLFMAVTHLYLVDDIPSFQISQENLPILAHIICTIQPSWTNVSTLTLLHDCMGRLAGRKTETLRSVTLHLKNIDQDPTFGENVDLLAGFPPLRNVKVAVKPAEEFSVTIWKGWMRDGKDAWSNCE